MIIYENEEIKIETTGRDYDFIATVENKTNKTIIINFHADDTNSFEIAPEDWVGLLANDKGYYELSLFTSNFWDYEIE